MTTPLLSGSIRGVQRTAELMRIVSIPRRIWTEENALAFAKAFSARIRRRGSGELRPTQAVFLYELFVKGGAVGAIRTGGGKTLITLLAPHILRAKRPLLLLPAKLIEKTKREMRELAHTWPIPNNLQIKSYEFLGRINQVDTLETYLPDLVIADECHKLKNKRAGVTQRVMRYVHAHPETIFVAVSGSLTNKSLSEYAHLVQMALPRPTNCPVPFVPRELEEWSDALDAKGTLSPGALLTYLCGPQDYAPGRTPRDVARHGFRRRLAETEGITATTETFTGSSLTVASVSCDMNKTIEHAFYQLRIDGERPDGKILLEAPDFKRHARELGLGFYYRWDPPPPEDWLLARRVWGKACREVLKTNRQKLDTPHAVEVEILSGRAYPEHRRILEDWKRIKPTFKPNTVPVWLDDSVIKLCLKWASDGPGIIWTEHVAFAQRLVEASKLSYYGRQGMCGNRFIDDHPANQPLIASAASNAEGRNLQKWHRNLFVGMPQGARLTEQVIARTHRDDQKAEEVTVDIVFTCAEHVKDYDVVINDARYVEASTGNAQKILYADTIIQPPISGPNDYYRWLSDEE